MAVHPTADARALIARSVLWGLQILERVKICCEELISIMTKEELKCFVALIDLVLRQSETQSSIAKSLLKRFETIDSLQQMKSELAGPTDQEVRKELCNRIQALENEAFEENSELFLHLGDAIARGESASEQVEAIVARLKKDLEE